MFAVITTYLKTDIEDKITYNLVDVKDLPQLIDDKVSEVSFSLEDGEQGEIFLFDSKEEAEKNMGAK